MDCSYDRILFLLFCCLLGQGGEMKRHVAAVI
jgi:hypothetical protein